METVTYPYRAPFWQMLLMLGLFGTTAVFLSRIVIAGEAAWYAILLFLGSLGFAAIGTLGLTRRGEVVLSDTHISAPASQISRRIVTLTRTDLVGVTTRGKGKDRYLWLQTGDRKLMIAERSLPDAGAFDHLVAHLSPPLDPASEQA